MQPGFRPRTCLFFDTILPRLATKDGSFHEGRMRFCECVVSPLAFLYCCNSSDSDSLLYSGLFILAEKSTGLWSGVHDLLKHLPVGIGQ